MVKEIKKGYKIVCIKDLKEDEETFFFKLELYDSSNEVILTADKPDGEEKDAVKDFEENEVKEYFLNVKNKDLVLISDLTDKNEIYKLVKDYIFSNDIFYGTILDTSKILKDLNVLIPDLSDKNISYATYQNTIKNITAISLEFTKQLKKCGFIVDRNSSGSIKEDSSLKNQGYLNYVFVRYPWHGAIKIIKTVAEIRGKFKTTNNDITKDYDILKKNNEDLWLYVVKLDETFKTLDKDINSMFIKRIDGKSRSFEKYLKEHLSSLQNEWSKFSTLEYTTQKEIYVKNKVP